MDGPPPRREKPGPSEGRITETYRRRRRWPRGRQAGPRGTEVAADVRRLGAPARLPAGRLRTRSPVRSGPRAGDLRSVRRRVMNGGHAARWGAESALPKGNGCDAEFK